MREQLALTEPSLDTSVGTVTRKLLDAVGEALSEVSIDRYLVDYQYDIQTKAGAELDRFVELFGFSRIAPRRATGLVQVTLVSQGAPQQQITIPAGTLFFTEDNPPVRFASVVPSIMFVGQTSVEVPVQAVDAGARGNVPATAISLVASSQSNNLQASNLQATSNGRDAESDAQLRRRFQATVFRKMAGTEDSFLGVALETEGVRAANVIGAQKVYREQVDVVSGEATSTLEGARFVYPSTVTFGKFIDGGDILLEGTHYTFDRSVLPPKVEIIDTSISDGLYELEFGYCPLASRNVPENDVTNRVDIWITGEEARQAPGRAVLEQGAAEAMKVGNRKFAESSSGNTEITRGNFLRWAYEAGDPIVKNPAVGNWFVPLSFGPIVTVNGKVNATIAGAAVEYTLGENCWIVHEDGPFGWAPRSRFGLEITDAAVPVLNPSPSGPSTVALAVGAEVTVDYSYNALPWRVQANVQDWRLVTTDVWVHQAKPKYLTVNFVVVPDVGFTKADIEREIDEVLSEVMDDLGFVKVLQASDVLRAAASATGVDGIRWATADDDSENFAIQQYGKSIANATDSESTTGYKQASLLLDVFEDDGRVTDVRVPDDEILVYNGCNVILRADNTFGTS